MNVRKFFGATTRDALREVRDALGADALILSNRRVEGGVEIMAVTDGEVQALTHDNRATPSQPEPFFRQPANEAPAIQPETIAAILHKRQGANPGPAQSLRVPEFQTQRSPSLGTTGAAAYMETAEAAAQPYNARVAAEPYVASRYAVPETLNRPPAAETFREPAPAMPRLGPVGDSRERTPPPAPAPRVDPLVAEMALELKRMRNLLESQLSGFAWGELARKDPLKADLMRTLLGSGFSPQLSRQLLDALPADLDVERGLKWIKAALAHNLRVVESGADFITRGGVHALVGPTGVGKTTTVAKLAARAVLKFGADKVALITTDSYRIGAHEQLKIYGRILNVPVHAVKDEAELELTLADLTRSHLILIDTVGMSQRDRRIAEQIEFLCGRGNRIKRHLILPATAQNVTLDDIVRAYRGSGMNGVILSKIDESMSIAPAVDCLIRHGLDLHYVTNGQKVPEDLHLANGTYLVDRAFKARADQEAFALQPDEWDVTAGQVAMDDAGGRFA
jgi:flagellar biosynthesis protein FlhF